jgi:hypothetical protein
VGRAHEGYSAYHPVRDGYGVYLRAGEDDHGAYQERLT